MASPSRGRRAPGHATQLLLLSSSAVCTRRVPPRAHAAGEDRAARRRRRRGRHLAGRPSESRATYCLVSRDRPPGVEARPPTSPRGWFPVPIRAPVGPWALQPTCRHLPPHPPPPERLCASSRPRLLPGPQRSAVRRLRPPLVSYGDGVSHQMALSASGFRPQAARASTAWKNSHGMAFDQRGDEAAGDMLPS